MYAYLLLLLLQVYNLYCIDDNVFIVTYFERRQITNVVGFTCDDNEQSAFTLVKMFSDNGQVIKIYDLKIESIMKLYFLKRTRHRVGIFVDKKCQDITLLERLYAEGTKLYLFSTVYKWLILTKDLNRTIQSVNDTNFSAETDLVIAVQDTDEYILHEAYNVCKYRGGILQINKIGKWKPNEFQASFFDKNVSRRWDYGGITLKIAGLVVYRPKSIEIPYYLQAYKNISKDSMTKFIYAVILHLADIYNFTVQPGEYREWKLTDNVGPVVKALHYREIDISGSPTVMTQARAQFVEYLFPIWPFRTFFIFRTTSLSHVRMEEFLMPLAMDCWYFIGILVIIAIIVFGTVLVFENINGKLEAYGVGFIITIGSLCQQGSAYIPFKTPGRIAFLNIMIFSLLIYNYYSASVVSTRLDKPLDKMNDSLVQLAKTDLTLAAEPSLFFDFLLNQTEWELSTFYHKRWLKIPKKDRFIVPEEGIKRVWAGGFAYHTTPEGGYPLIERSFDNRKICELTEVHVARPTNLYLNTRLNSPFSEMSRLGSIIMLERGLLRRQVKRWQTRTPECRRDVLSADSITIVEVAPTFFVLMLGILLSIIIFQVEKIIHYINHKDKFNLLEKKLFNVEKFKEVWLMNKIIK